MQLLSFKTGVLFLVFFQAMIENTFVPLDYTRCVIEDWKLVKEEDNIKVFTRNGQGNIKEIKMEIILYANKEDFLQYLNDANLYKEWVFKCTDSKMLETINSNEFYYYTLTDLPFPVSDRDLVVKCTQWTDDNGYIHSTSKSVPDYISAKSGIVRIQKYESSWLIKQYDQNTLYIEYKSSSDPGGWIPNWIVNLAVTQGPLKSIKQLQALLKG